eukprot:TRINITY_DN11555_c0_g2_i1.p2 TRINITY_DN11555_c0_g2~~TRINITY_DN11555_c0_g2_i1.p2  ORF type:complete len:57 (-),score=3.03 TRINITY_DN11555_c0_g2_i1:185-355(-)
MILSTFEALSFVSNQFLTVSIAILLAGNNGNPKIPVLTPQKATVLMLCFRTNSKQV